jgi:hypothetical protein
MAIEHYKKLIKMRKEKSKQRDDLVQKLIKLRLRLQQEKVRACMKNTLTNSRESSLCNLLRT